MIYRINEIVLTAIKNYNSEFNNISINNNIISYNNDNIDLKFFNLETLFESYQLKLDLNNMKAEDLFKIIKINANLYNSNREQ